MKTINVKDIENYVGKDLGAGDWMIVDQERINQFAEVTEDHQFIHIDPIAAAKTPFGGTIAHGFLTLSLLSKLIYDTGLGLDGAVLGVNYGFDKVRFVDPVPSGSSIRGHFTLKSAMEKKSGQWFMTYAVTVEIEGKERPALTAEWISMQLVQS